jgi:signal transduction histidine kinase
MEASDSLSSAIEARVEASARGEHASLERLARCVRVVEARGVEPVASAERLALLEAELLARHEESIELQRRLAQAERAAALGELVGRIAHELGTPLHSVAGHLQLMLQSPELSNELRDRVEVVAGEVDRLSALIRSHLRRLRSPRPRTQTVDLGQLVRHVAAVVEPELRTRQIRLQLALAPGALDVACDRDQIEQVLLNLVQNAIDAMSAGGQLVVRTLSVDEGHAVSVCDDGAGIAEDHVARIFDPFFTTKEEGRGSGLGLPLCREIARNHGGDLRVDSKPGEGTVATVLLRRPGAETR